MTKRKVPDRPHWMGRCKALEAQLESMGYYVSYGKSHAMVQPMVPCVKHRQVSLWRRFWHRVNWLVGT